MLPAALAMALLYLSVMSLGLLMTAYLKWHGMEEATLSLARGLGAASGIAATFAFPVLHSRTGGVTAETHEDVHIFPFATLTQLIRRPSRMRIRFMQLSSI